MTVKQLDNAKLRDVVYYILVVWTDKHGWGETFPIAYMRKANAKRRMNDLVNSGLYECVMMRKEDVAIRDGETEISSSGLEELWEGKADAETALHRQNQDNQ